MPLPDVSLTVLDGALGIVPPALGETPAFVGTSSAGTNATPQSFGSIPALVAAYGYGPMVESAALALATAGKAVVVCKIATGTAGSNTAVTHNGTGTSVMTLVGAPYNSFEGIVKVLTAGTIGTNTPQIQVSLDGGNTYGPAYQVPTSGDATIVLTYSGLTLHFAVGTFVVGDTYTWTSTEPLPDWTAMAAAFAALDASPLQFGFVHVSGKATAANSTTVDTAVASMATNFRYVSAITHAKDFEGVSEASWITSITTDYVAFSSTRVNVAAGWMRLTSVLSGYLFRRPISMAAAARAAKVEIHQDIGRVRDGGIQGVAMGIDGFSIYHDERVTPGLDAARFTTTRTYPGLTGVYFTEGLIMASVGSDFSQWVNRRVMDVGCATVRASTLPIVNDSVRVMPTTGYIVERDARAIEAAVQAALRATLVAQGHASATTTVVSRTDNILSTKRITISVRILPLGYSRYVQVDIGFTNPAVQIAA